MSFCDNCYKIYLKRKEQRANRPKCHMIKQDGKKCHYASLQGKRMCKPHSNYEKYTDDELNELIQCSGCKKMWTSAEMSSKAMCIKCKIKNTKVTTTTNFKCKFIFQDRNKCTYSVLPGKQVCKRHINYENKVNTNIEHINKCSGCNRFYTDEELNGYKSCTNCRNRIKPKKNKNEDQDEDEDENEDEDDNKFVKAQVNKCTSKWACNTIPEKGFSWCKLCRERERLNRKKLSKDNKCRYCKKSLEIDEEIFNKIHYKCKEKERENDIRRKHSKKRIEWTKKYEKSDKRIEYKKEYNNENKENRLNYYKNTRDKRKEEMGEDEYLKHNATIAKQWREHNPDKNKMHQKKLINNPKYRLSSEKMRAIKEGICWELEDSYSYDIITSNCFYCDEKNNESCNGIDRLHSDKTYNQKNCVSCCNMCNTIKNTMNVYVFLNKIWMILSNKNIVDKGYIDDNCCYVNINKVHHYVYKNRADKKNLSFELCKTEFDNITKNTCYLCDYTKTNNGIDRVDSNKGYIIDNCKPCCGQCNFMKNKYDLDKFLNKLNKIHKRRMKILVDIKIVDCGKKFFMFMHKTDMMHGMKWVNLWYLVIMIRLMINIK